VNASKKIHIRSENSDFQFIETLRRNRAKRQKSRSFFVEGVRQINLLLEHYWQIQGLYYAEDRVLSSWAQGVIEKAHEATLFELPTALLEKLSQKNETSELLAVVSMPGNDLTRIPLKNNFLTVLIDRSANPGNLGTILRSCDALGVHGVVVTGHSVDLYDPAVIAASAGSLFALPTVRLPSHNEVTPWLEKVKSALPEFQIIGSSAQGTKALQQQDFTNPTLLLVGNETKGLSHAYKELCDTLVTIPMAATSTASSLNVACATTVMLYEVGRQRAA